MLGEANGPVWTVVLTQLGSMLDKEANCSEMMGTSSVEYRVGWMCVCVVVGCVVCKISVGITVEIGVGLRVTTPLTIASRAGSYNVDSLAYVYTTIDDRRSSPVQDWLCTTGDVTTAHCARSDRIRSGTPSRAEGIRGWSDGRYTTRDVRAGVEVHSLSGRLVSL